MKGNITSTSKKNKEHIERIEEKGKDIEKRNLLAISSPLWQDPKQILSKRAGRSLLPSRLHTQDLQHLSFASRMIPLPLSSSVGIWYFFRI